MADGGLPGGGGGGRERRWDPGHPPRGTRSLALFLSDNTALILKACRPHITVTTSLGFPSRLKTHSLCLAPAGQHCWVIFKMCKLQFAFSPLQHFTVAYVVAFMFCTVQTHNVTKPATGLKGQFTLNMNILSLLTHFFHGTQKENFKESSQGTLNKEEMTKFM